MLPIPRRYSHFLFGAIQSGLTSLVAAGIASAPFLSEGAFFRQWLGSWVVSWLVMLPIVLLAAPQIRRLSQVLTQSDESRGKAGSGTTR